jgi:hypothetical protein
VKTKSIDYPTGCDFIKYVSPKEYKYLIFGFFAFLLEAISKPKK